MKVSKAAIRRLRLKPGDMLVVRNHQQADALMGAGPLLGLDFDVRIIIAPEGVKRLGRKYLEKLLEKNKENQ